MTTLKEIILLKQRCSKYQLSDDQQHYDTKNEEKWEGTHQSDNCKHISSRRNAVTCVGVLPGKWNKFCCFFANNHNLEVPSQQVALGHSPSAGNSAGAFVHPIIRQDLLGGREVCEKRYFLNCLGNCSLEEFYWLSPSTILDYSEQARISFARKLVAFLPPFVLF